MHSKYLYACQPPLLNTGKWMVLGRLLYGREEKCIDISWKESCEFAGEFT